jgi:arsenate reductase
MSSDLARRSVAEFTGTALLVAVVVGSGIAAQRLSSTDVGLQLFENAAATAAGLVAIILAVGPVSGAHLNPVVSVADAIFGGLAWRGWPRTYRRRLAVGCWAPSWPT